MKFAHIAALLLLVLAAPALAAPDMFGHSSKTYPENVGEMTQNQRDGLEKMQDGARYFGAMFVEKGGRGWGTYKGANRLEDALDLAKRICDRWSDRGTCVLAAVTLPAGLELGALPRNSLNKAGSEEYVRYEIAEEGFRAFAASRNIAVGWAFAQPTPQAAIEAALKDCTRSSMTHLLRYDVDLRAKAIKEGLFDCRVIDSAGPGN